MFYDVAIPIDNNRVLKWNNLGSSSYDQYNVTDECAIWLRQNVNGLFEYYPVGEIPEGSWHNETTDYVFRFMDSNHAMMFKLVWG